MTPPSSFSPLRDAASPSLEAVPAIKQISNLTQTGLSASSSFARFWAGQSPHSPSPGPSSLFLYLSHQKIKEDTIIIIAFYRSKRSFLSWTVYTVDCEFEFA